MALHDSPASMLKESLDELIEAARFCVWFKKTDTIWGNYQGEGCLGYPAGVLLFSIIDSIGSYFRKSFALTIIIDGQPHKINGDGWEHFKILNSKYFNQSLPMDFIKALYSKYRSQLTHNSVLGKDALILPDNSYVKSDHNTGNLAFAIYKTESGKDGYLILLKALFSLCQNAIIEFKKDIDSIVPNSKQGKVFH